ncbi:hypothetical protein P3T37_002808 [Kitasatospora sp. MAA4]|uniref:maleylpyruvate isomerase N-terminal domain-containing protein n=1 Tax=Kitasatospora sp. MAA4 TaxID=3035093 RepID=UPI0024747847|nr:maleylpyruvate isomerase N-terminal domain-containing protein [Kitasatospora sp. MAA4]MDH6133413.1 hypothetical protein [Kitasatospora sp. MAA4]
MTDLRADFLSTARSAGLLLHDPAVASAWDKPSALAEFGVAGLAGHLAYQVLSVVPALSGEQAPEPVISLLDHYARAQWLGTGVDSEVNVGIRRGGEAAATEGAQALAARFDSALAELTDKLATTANRPVRMPVWGPWTLLLDDLLITRLMELAVHSDDLAVSVGIPTPELAPGAATAVIDLLSRLATRRHGQSAVLRALSRAERAPDRISAF